MAVSPPRALVLLVLAAAADSRRSVSWFTSGGYWPTGTDGLNFSSWLAAHGPGSAAPAITGTQPCCGCWGVNATSGLFSSGCAAANAKSAAARHAHAVAQAAGLTIEPTGILSAPFLLNESWMLPGSLDSAVAMVESAGWTGLAIDNEDYTPANGKGSSPRLPEQFRRFLGNLTKVMTAAKKTVVVDVCSTWHGDIGGPGHLPGYAKAANNHIRFMDMATYYSDATEQQKLSALTKMVPLQTIAPAVGLTATGPVWPGYLNASCGGWHDGKQCANVTDPHCGCIDYKWCAPRPPTTPRAQPAAELPAAD